MAILREEREILRAKFSSAPFVPICRAIHAYLTRQWRSDGLDKDGYYTYFHQSESIASC